ncbi:MAG: hypothetical protein QXT33_02440 [Thermofilum sp.]
MFDTLTSLALIILGVVLAFFGVKLAKLLVSLSFGLAVGYLLYAYASPSLTAAVGRPVLFAVGFIAGALIGFSTFKLAVSLLAGFLAAYSLAAFGIIVNAEEAVALLSLAFAAVLYYLAERLLALVFALAGAGMVLLGSLGLGLGTLISLVLAFVVFAAGLARKK